MPAEKKSFMFVALWVALQVEIRYKNCAEVFRPKKETEITKKGNPANLNLATLLDQLLSFISAL